MTRKPRRVAPAIPVWATIRSAYHLTFSPLGRWLITVLVVVGCVALVAAPLLVAVFQSGLAAAGLGSLTTATLPDLVASPGSILLVVLFLVLSVVAIIAQAAVLAVMADHQQRDGAMARPRVVALRVAQRMRSLARPSTLLVLPYLLLLAPLGHAALGSVLTRWIAIPNFISGELMRSATGSVLWIVISLALWYVNLRLVLAIPFMVVGGMTAPQAFRASWAATRWRIWRLVAVILGVVIPATVALMVLGALALAATAIADVVAPDAAPVVAGIGLAIAQVVGFFVVGIALVMQTQVFVRIVRDAEAGWGIALRLGPSGLAQGAESAEPPLVGDDTPAIGLPDDAPALGLPDELAPGSLGDERQPRSRSERSESEGLRWAAAAAIVTTLAATVLLAFAAVPALARYADGSTLVIAHRGVTDRAVENTLEALEAAAAAGADAVEFDVQQTKDGDWVVMHDFDLERLAGISGAVKDMTLEEATTITVREGGNEGRVPSMREWVERAVELDMRLLIEIKPHGQETDDYLARFYAILDEAGITQSSLYHSLSGEVVAGQKELRPETTVGYIVPIAFGAGLPDTPADFLVVEEFSYSPTLRTSLHDSGRGVFVWTVNEENAMRDYLREGVDGIVSDEAALLIEQRAVVAGERALAPKLFDALGRALTLW